VGELIERESGNNRSAELGVDATAYQAKKLDLLGRRAECTRTGECQHKPVTATFKPATEQHGCDGKVAE
jgi:hypothetical protein